MTIAAAGFSNYYETRTGPGAKPGDLPQALAYDDPQAQRQFAVDEEQGGRVAWRS